jgi:Fe-S cluster biogenesis protein NfuA
MQGACVGCPMSEITLKMGVEATLMDALEEVKEVISVN